MAERFDARICVGRKAPQGGEVFHQDGIIRYALVPVRHSLVLLQLRASVVESSRVPPCSISRGPATVSFVTRMMAERPSEQVPIIMTSALPDYHLLRPNVVTIPLRVRQSQSKSAVQDSLFAADDIITANLSPTARAYLATLGIADPDGDAEIAPGLRAYELIWLHTSRHRLLARLPARQCRRHPRRLAAHPAPGRPVTRCSPRPRWANRLRRCWTPSGPSPASRKTRCAPSSSPSRCWRGRRRQSRSLCWRSGHHRGLGSRRQGRRHHAGQGAGSGTRAGSCVRHLRSTWHIIRHLPQQRGLLAQHTGPRLGLHHRRLPGHQEVAELPGKGSAGAGV